MSTSPPPTPPSRSPDDDECRFKIITSPCEWVEDYRPGGYHPVHLGDTLHDGQYKVIHKLGEGSYSSVWLAHDLINKRYVALKIQVSQVSTCSNELPVLRHIARQLPEQGETHVTKLLDEFQHNGPNGAHACLVFEPMGPSANTIVEELPQFKPRKFGMKIRYPPPMAKSILKQSLLALEFLQKHGISHGDFQPGNILFALHNIDSTPEEVVRQKEDVQARSISPLVERLDAAGYKAIFLSVDTPCLGRHLNEYRNNFTLPDRLEWPDLLSNGRDELGSREDNPGAPSKHDYDPSIDWNSTIPWLRKHTKMEI
ncbi:hypothetical protein NW757_012860 [Fusarium falciforme]|nr:hypothetical protein NW757_012860 [Fusarium falciforme]